MNVTGSPVQIILSLAVPEFSAAVKTVVRAVTVKLTSSFFGSHNRVVPETVANVVRLTVVVLFIAI